MAAVIVLSGDDGEGDALGESLLSHWGIVINSSQGRYNTRRSSQGSAIEKSGSEYNEHADGSDDEMDVMDDPDAEGEYEEPMPEPKVKEFYTRSGRSTRLRGTYVESTDGDDDEQPVALHSSRSRSARVTRNTVPASDEDQSQLRRSGRIKKSSSTTGSRSGSVPEVVKSEMQSEARSRRLMKRQNAREVMESQSFELPEEGDHNEDHEDDIPSDAEQTADSDRPQVTTSRPRKPVFQQEIENEGYSFRKRAKVNYAIPPPLEEMQPLPAKPRNRPKARKGPGWSAGGAELSRFIPLGDDSVSLIPLLWKERTNDLPFRIPMDRAARRENQSALLLLSRRMLPMLLA